MNVQIHPLATIIPEMTNGQFAELKADIQENGLRDAITLLDGKIIDGRNRYRACVELGKKPIFQEFPGGDPEAFVISRNLKRRHLTADQQKILADARRKKVAEMRQQGMSTRKIAEKLDVSQKTVRDDLEQEVSTPTHLPEPQQESKPAPVSDPPKVTGRDGKQYPATKPLRPLTKKPPGMKDIPARVPIPRPPEGSTPSDHSEIDALRDFVRLARQAAEALKRREGIATIAKLLSRQKRLEVASEVDALARVMNGIVQQLKTM